MSDGRRRNGGKLVVKGCFADGSRRMILIIPGTRAALSNEQHPPVTRGPPPCQPPLADRGLVGGLKPLIHIRVARRWLTRRWLAASASLAAATDALLKNRKAQRLWRSPIGTARRSVRRIGNRLAALQVRSACAG